MELSDKIDEWFGTLAHTLNLQEVVCDKCKRSTGIYPPYSWKARHFAGQCYQDLEATTSEARGEYNPMNQTTRVHCPACGKMVTNCEHGVSSVFTDDPYKFGTIYPEIPPLSLLIIDLGESTVIKVESGAIEPFYGERLVRGRIWFGQGIHFSAVRGVLDAMDEKPIPRLVRDPEGDYEFFYNHDNPHPQKPSQHISVCGYNALCQLAQTTIPVYEGGKWELLIAASSAGRKYPLEVWRYVRD